MIEGEQILPEMTRVVRVRTTSRPVEPRGKDTKTTKLTTPRQNVVGFSNSVPGGFRSKIERYETQPEVWLSTLHLPRSTSNDFLLAKFPTAPRYQVNEEVYLTLAGQSQPAGPYLVTAILVNNRYRLKQKDNGQQLQQEVKEEDLVVPVS